MIDIVIENIGNGEICASFVISISYKKISKEKNKEAVINAAKRRLLEIARADEVDPLNFRIIDKTTARVLGSGKMNEPENV